VESTASPLLDDPRVARAAAHARATDEETLADQVALTEIAAPPFRETARAAAMVTLLRRSGLTGVRIDEIGNVLALRSGAEASAPVVLSAHLDTVFPEGTPVAVARVGDLLKGPGISDDGRGLAVLLAVARALEAGGIVTRRPILFAATVGEEGLGDLRGVRHLVGAKGAGHGSAAFISVDGAGLDRVVSRGLGSRRFRVEMRGPGGHSWQDRGTVNPIHALARVVTRLIEDPPSPEAETSLAVTRCGGGLSINSIPGEAWVEIDCRGTDETDLERSERELRAAVQQALAEANARGRGSLETAIRLVGSRPAAATEPDALLVRATRVATEAVGSHIILALSSTDANAAMAVDIPAVTFGGGGQAGLAHTTGEWYRNVQGVEGVLRALYTVVLVAGVVEPAGRG